MNTIVFALFTLAFVHHSCAAGCCRVKSNHEEYSRFTIITEFKANWMTGWLYCKKIRMQLAHVNSETELNELSSMLDATGIEHMSVWLSGTSYLQKNAKYHWASTGQPLSYTRWSPNEPNNANENEFCLQMYHRLQDGQWMWNDNNCAIELHFVCRS